MHAAQFEPTPNGPNALFQFIHNPFNSNLKPRGFDRSSSYSQTFGKVVPSALLLKDWVCGPFCGSSTSVVRLLRELGPWCHCWQGATVPWVGSVALPSGWREVRIHKLRYGDGD